MTIIKALTFVSPGYGKERKRRVELKKWLQTSSISVMPVLAFIAFTHSCGNFPDSLCDESFHPEPRHFRGCVKKLQIYFYLGYLSVVLLCQGKWGVASGGERSAGSSWPLLIPKEGKGSPELLGEVGDPLPPRPPLTP